MRDFDEQYRMVTDELNVARDSQHLTIDTMVSAFLRRLAKR